MYHLVTQSQYTSPPVKGNLESLTYSQSDRLRNVPKHLNIYKADLPPSLVNSTCRYHIHNHLITQYLAVIYKFVIAPNSTLV